MEPGARSLKLTYEDYLCFPDDGKRHELIDGEHYVTPAPNLKHQTTVGRLHRFLGNFVEPRRLGQVWVAPVDVLFSGYDVVQPDLVFLSQDRMGIAADGINVKGAPDLAVEVFSPSTRRTDAIIKGNLYQKNGVPEYWLVDPELEIIQVYRLVEGTYRREAELAAEREDVLTSPLFPGLEMALTEIFE
jgi:Uma2 family endonuclease